MGATSCYVAVQAAFEIIARRKALNRRQVLYVRLKMNNTCGIVWYKSHVCLAYLLPAIFGFRFVTLWQLARSNAFFAEGVCERCIEVTLSC